MKSLGEAADRLAETAAKRARWKRNAWSRHWDGFCDRPLFRLVADRLELPPYQVIAFAMRLEELANRSEPRGSIESFSAGEFGIALGMTAGDAARIFGALCEDDIGYIAYGHIADFYDRNRDSDSDREGAKERQRRVRARRDAMKVLSRLAAHGTIDGEERLRIERLLALPPRKFPNDDLFALAAAIERAELSTEPRHLLSQVTLSQRDSVTVTQEQTKNLEARAVDNSGSGAGGETAGLSGQEVEAAADDPQAAARQWIASVGRAIAVRRMPDEQPGRVDLLLARWCEQDLEGDAAALMTTLIECDRLGHAGGSFQVAVTQGCARARRQKAAREDKQPTLPLAQLVALRKIQGG